MKSMQGYLPNQSSYPSMGLNSRDPSTMADQSFTPDAKNVTFYKGTIAKRRGYRQVGSALDGTVMEVIKFEVSEGVVKTVVVTTTKEYVWDGSDWSNITYQSAGVDVDKTGDTDDVIQWCVGTDSNGTFLYFTNGVDPIRKWDGVSAKMELATVNSSGFTTCKTLTVFEGSLLLGNLVGTNEPKTIVWSDTGNFEEYTAGNADVQLIPDADGPIQRLMVVGDRLAIYTQNSLFIATFVGGDVSYTVEKILTNTRLLSSRSMVDVGPFHVYASEENCYIFQGSRQILPVGDVVQSLYREDTALDRASSALSFYDSINTQIFNVIPDTTGKSLIWVNELQLDDYSTRRWARLQFADDPKCLGYYVQDQSMLWNSPSIAGITWEHFAKKWNDLSLRAGFPVLVFGSGGKVFLYDETVYGDDGENVEAWVDTIDFTVPTEYRSRLGRWGEVEMELRGSSVTVQYSTDLGVTWQAVNGSNRGNFSSGVQSLTSDWTRYRFWIDTVSETIRFRLYDNGITDWFERRWLKVWVQAQGDY